MDHYLNLEGSCLAPPVFHPSLSADHHPTQRPFGSGFLPASGDEDQGRSLSHFTQLLGTEPQLLSCSSLCRLMVDWPFEDMAFFHPRCLSDPLPSCPFLFLFLTHITLLSHFQGLIPGFFQYILMPLPLAGKALLPRFFKLS